MKSVTGNTGPGVSRRKISPKMLNISCRLLDFARHRATKMPENAIKCGLMKKLSLKTGFLHGDQSM
jgi:hypothetical protein